jgi:hypothetical protein
LLTIIIWGASGPLFGYSDIWQLVINTGTTIITFLMVFLIQKTQNRDTETIHLKLDELIRVTKGARNMMLDLEHMDDESRWLDLPLPLKGGFPLTGRKAVSSQNQISSTMPDLV